MRGAKGVIFMREHDTRRGAFLSVAIAAVFVIAAFAVMVNDDAAAPSSEKDAYLGGGTYTVGTGGAFANLASLPALADGDQIVLISDVVCTVTFEVDRDITLDLDGYTLTFNFGSNDHMGIEVFESSKLTIIGGGTIEVFTDGGGGIYVYDKSEAEIYADIVVDGGSGIEVSDSVVYLEGNVTSNYRGISAIQGSEVTAIGNICVDGTYGIHADESTVLFEGNIDVTGIESSGVYAIYHSEVTVEGNIVVTGDESSGVYATLFSKVSVEGDITCDTDNYSAAIVSTFSSEICIIGDVMVNGDDTYAIFATDASKVTVEGDITLTGDGSKGAYVAGPAEATIIGTLTIDGASDYLYLCYSEDSIYHQKAFGPDENVTPSTKAGYLTYAYGNATVWILDPNWVDPGTGGNGSGDGGSDTGGDDDGGLETWMIILIAVVAIGAIGAVVYFFVLRKS